ncbi:MAG: flagellar filament capping protein FliD [Syntrophobacteraceae bacterium]
MSTIPTIPMTSSSASSNLSLTGLGTNIDWQSMLTELTQVSDESLTPYNNQIQTCNNEVSAWQSFGGLLSTLQTASDALTSSGTGLDVYSANVSSSSSVSASSLLSATASPSAGNGNYQVVISNTAQAEKLGSGSFSSETGALNISGTILVNDQAVQIASTDSLQDIENNINSLNSGATPSGVTANIVQDSSTTYRLEITSDNTGASGISLLNGSASDTLGSLGFNGTGTSIKNQVTGGAQSDSFSSSSTGVAALLGMANSTSGTVTINGKTVAIDLSDTLQTIQSDMVAAGIPASIVSSTSGSQTSYNLQIAGMTSYTDQNNVLQSLGLIQGNRNDTIGVTGSAANTSDGSTPITAATDITSIYGYNQYTSGDTIAISGTTHNGTAVAATNFAITPTTTVGDLLNQIDSLFGNVTASITSQGKIQVIDNATGTSDLSVNLQSSLQNPNAGELNFGSFGQAGTIQQRVLQQGEDASFTVDGASLTSSTNTVTNAIPGVTLNLLGADPKTTLTVNVSPDTQTIEDNVNTMLNAYNAVMSYINGQMSYTPGTSTTGTTGTAGTTGGPLFGNNTLQSIKTQLQSAITSQVGTGSMDYLADIGITVGSTGQLSLNTTTLENAISNNFSGVVNLLSNSATCSNSQFQYVYSNSNTQSGTYNINISQLSGTGQNIAGTIDGLDASGSGNVLTLNNAASNANGLEISYTGTTVPASATVTVNRGIASLIDGLTSEFTNSVTGTVTAQETGLQNTITSLNSTVSQMQNSINQQMATLQQEFITMDTTVASLDSMQSYLTTQLASLDG